MNKEGTMNNKVKAVLIASVLVLSPALWAGCESSILEGAHTALKKKDAKLGAWEDAKEVCYPGVASKLSMRCEKVSGAAGVQGKKARRCVQEVSCNICDDDLTRKYEALN